MNRFSKFIETIHLAWFIAARSHSMPFYSLGSLLWVWFIPILLPSLIHVFTCIMLLSAEKCFAVEMIRLLFGMVLCNAWFAWAWECQYFRPFFCVCVFYARNSCLHCICFKKDERWMYMRFFASWLCDLCCVRDPSLFISLNVCVCAFRDERCLTLFLLLLK